MATLTTLRPASEADETLHHVEWDTYCKLRDDPANHHLRMHYRDGDLTIMSPRIVHDFDARSIFLVVLAVARACRIDFMPVGTTTLRKKGVAPLEGAGKEPDDGFFLGINAVRMKSKKILDLEIDPPPDLAIEIDHTSNSAAAMPTYARIGVPEVWRFDVSSQTLWLGRLAGDRYEEVDRSYQLDRLTPALVIQALEIRDSEMAFIDWLGWLDAWARALPEPE